MNGSQGRSDLSRRRRLLILVICSMSLLIVGLDVTIVNVALPAIHRSLGASVSGLQWTIDAYTLTIATLVPILDLQAANFVPKLRPYMDKGQSAPLALQSAIRATIAESVESDAAWRADLIWSNFTAVGAWR